MKSLNDSRVYDGNCAEECYHELGHLLGFIHHGIKVESVTVGDGCGRTRVPAQDIDDPLGYLIGLCSGKACVDKWRGHKMPSDEAWRKSTDNGHAYRAALEVSRGDHKAASLLVKWAERMADS